VTGECVSSSPRDLTIGDKGLTTLSLRSFCLLLKACVCVAQKGKGLCFVVVVFVFVFLSISMGLDLDCYVPFSAPSPKKFTVFRGSGILSLPVNLLKFWHSCTGLVAVTTSPIL
jgi:hypothetical protein